MTELKPTMLTVQQCAEIYGMPEYRLRRWVRDGQFHFVQCGSKVLINEASFLEFLTGKPVEK
jgi:excisionase family DNA binding protein